MRRVVLSVAVLLAIGGLGSCGDVARVPRASGSTFLTDFSLSPILEANEQFLIAKHTISGSAVSEPPSAFFQKHEEAVVQVDARNISAFMAGIVSDIEQLLTESGAQIDGRGRGGIDGQGPGGTLSDVDYYSLRYSQDGTDGIVNVWGVAGKETSFALIVLITEK